MDHIAYEINYIVVCVQLYADELCLDDTPRFVSYIVINGALSINSLNFVLFRHFFFQIDVRSIPQRDRFLLVYFHDTCIIPESPHYRSVLHHFKNNEVRWRI